MTGILYEKLIHPISAKPGWFIVIFTNKSQEIVGFNLLKALQN